MSEKLNSKMSILEVLGDTGDHGANAVLPGLFGLSVHDAAELISKNFFDDEAELL